MQYVDPDLILMSVVIFLPTLFALLLLAVPRGQEEVMRWVTLFGTALTLVASAWLLIDYLKLQDIHRSEPLQSYALAARADLDYKAHHADPKQVPKDQDLVGREPWIPRFSIEYFLGAD